MAKIFISFFNALENINNGAMPCFYESLLKSLYDQGNEILYFSNTYFNQDINKPPRYFIEKIKKFNPELIILFNNSCFDIAKYFECTIIIWEVDSYLYFTNKEKIKKNPNRFIYIVPQEISISNIKNYFNVNSNNIFLLPPSTSIKAEKKTLISNISFIGTKFGNKDIANKFMALNPNKNEIKLFKKIIFLLEERPFSSKNDLIERFNIRSNKIINCLYTKEIIEDISAKNRIQILSSVASLGLNIYGTKSWIDNLPFNPELVLSYKNKSVYSIKHNQDIYNSSKIGININHAQAQDSFSLRVCDIMASNACIVTQPKKELQRMFPKIVIPTYTNTREAFEICKKLLDNQSYRLDIVQQSQEIINKKYRLLHRIQDLEKITKIQLTNNNAKKNTKIQVKNTCTFININNNINNNNIINNVNNVIKKHIKINKNKKKLLICNKLRIKVRYKLMAYSVLLIINQIPFINKIFISRETILEQIKKTIDNEKNI